MARLFPENFDLTSLQQWEQEVASHFMRGLDASWLVIPKIPIVVDHRDREIDLILVSFDHGVFLVEVKGGIITVEKGQWKQNGRRLDDPVEQLTGAKHALVSRLRRSGVNTDIIFLQNIVAFPHIVDFPEDGAGPNCPREIVFTKLELQYPTEALHNLRESTPSAPKEDIEALLRALRPDVRQVDVDGSHVTGTTQRLMSSSADRLGPVIGLDENKRVYLRGSAGTGKTFVAKRWVRRALLRGERTLYVCYNTLLGDQVSTELTEIAKGIDVEHLLTSGTFHSVILRLMGDRAPEIGNDMSQEWWDTTLPDLFMSALGQIPGRFDTVVIDEGQDFKPGWLETIESLMEDRANGRLYLMADRAQAIFTSEWVPPSGITTLELTHNVRNSGNIGAVVERLGGAPTPAVVAPGPEVQFARVAGMKEAVKAVKKSIAFATTELSIPPSQLIILVTHRSERDRLISELSSDLPVSRWDFRSEDTIPCETVHRTKGLERNGVILVDLDEEPNRTLTYIGASRASAYLSVIGRPTLINLLAGPSESPEDVEQHQAAEHEERHR